MTDLRFFCVLMAVALAIGATSKAVAANDNYTAQEIRTNAVNESGTRHDTDSSECIKVPNGQLFEQASFQTRVVSHQDDDSRRCTATFTDYEDIAPGIREPRSACLYSYVRSVGGILNFGKRGHLQCAMEYRTHEDFGVIAAAKAASGDAKGTVVGLPADLALERASRSLVTISVPLRTLQFSIDQSIRDQKDMNLPAGFKLQVMSSSFRNHSDGGLVLQYYVDLDISGPVGARCETDVRFSIPAAHVDGFLIQDAGTTSNCKTGSELGQWFNLGTVLSEAIREAIVKNLGKQLLGGNDTFKDWAKDDPELAAMLQKAYLQGRYCNWRSEQGLCLAVGWRKTDTIASWEATLLSRVPKREGAIDAPSAKAKLESFSLDAIANRQAEAGGIRYPTGRTEDGSVEDGDMAIFGGLLCRSGMPEGCKLLRDVNTADGRFWRSPRRIGEADTKDHSTFSGDQLKGVLNYFLVSKDKPRLEAFLKYISGQKTPVPDASFVLESGYSSCPNFGPNFTCLIGGSDWRVLKLLAIAGGFESKLPGDFSDMELRYGFSYDTLVWEALMTNAGYRLHLVANSAWLLRSIGEKDERLNRVFSLLAARQPDNPFFLYLAMGSDRRVQRLLDQKCTDPTKRKNFSDWGWQRAESDKAWERSMVWDCAFMYGLLVRDPIPQ